VYENRDEVAAFRVFDLTSGAERFAATRPGQVDFLALADRARLLAIGSGTQIGVYEPPSGKCLGVLDSQGPAISDVAFTASGEWLASASAEDGTLRLWNPRGGEPLAILHTGQKRLTGVACSAAGRWLAVGSDRGQVLLWDLQEVRRRLAEAGLDWSLSPP